MLNFKKVLNLKIVSIVMILSFISTSALYSYPVSKDSLRVPIDRSNYARQKVALASGETIGMPRREFLTAATAAVFSAPLIFAKQEAPSEETNRIIPLLRDELGYSRA